MDSRDGRTDHLQADPVVELRGVQRHFGQVHALAGLDLVVPENRITVLLGPNGAGKTTAIRMITGALEPHQGQVRTFGLDPAVHGEQVRQRCGVVSAKPALYDRLDGHANLSYAAELYGLGRGTAVDVKIRAAAARFGIDHALDQRVGGFSTGMKTRLALARAILHEPDLLLFDEPTSGLDPEGPWLLDAHGLSRGPLLLVHSHRPAADHHQDRRCPSGEPGVRDAQGAPACRPEPDSGHHAAWFFPTAQWWVLMLWVVPPFLALTLSIVLRLSARVKSSAAAQQAAGLVSLPMIGLAYSQSTGALFGARFSGLVVGLVAWGLAIIGLRRGMRAVSRSRLLGVNDGI